MLVTVAICTWNRARLLDQTLTQMHQLRAPAGVSWELLVVNNNCTDDTDAVLDRHSPHLPLRRLVETRQGHSHARNCAIAAARGDLLLWTDDDVLVEPDWLAAYAQAADSRPESAFFGGTVLPWYEVEPPTWVRQHIREFERVFVMTDHGPEVRPLRAGEHIVGASMAFRTEVARANPYNTELGRVGSRLTGADDTDMVERLRQEGRQGTWVGSARLKHFIPAERLTLNFLHNYYVGAGRTHVRTTGEPTGRSVFGIPLWVLRQWGMAEVKSWCYSVGRGACWLSAFRQSRTLRGVIHELRERRQARPPVAAPTGGQTR